MSAAFDPYHKWLGIPPAEQPPNHYRLLAIPLFETDADVIDAAADARMTHLRTFSAGKNGPIAQKLLNEVSAARVTLLNPQARAAYDAQLQSQLAALEAARLHAQQAQMPPPVLPPAVDPAGEATFSFNSPQAGPAFEIVATSHQARRSGGATFLLLALVGILAVSASLGGLWYVLRGRNTDTTIVENPIAPLATGDATNPLPATTPTGGGTETPAATTETSSASPATTPPSTTPGAEGSTNAPSDSSPTASAGSSSPNGSTPGPSAPADPPEPGVGIVELKGHKGPVLSVDFSANGQLAVSGGEDKTVRVWDVERRLAIRLFEGMPSAVRCVRMSADGQFIAIACPEPEPLLRVWHVERPGAAVDLRLEGEIESFAMSPDGGVIVAGREGLVQVFNTRSGMEISQYEVNGHSTAIAREGQRIYAAGPGNVIRRFDLGQPDPTEFPGVPSQIVAIAVSADDAMLLSGGNDRMLRLWDTMRRDQVLNVRTQEDIRSVSLNGDSRRCAVLGESSVTVWELPSRQPLFTRNQSGDCPPVISADGCKLLTGDADGAVLLVSLPVAPPAPTQPQRMLEDEPSMPQDGDEPAPRNGNLGDLVSAPPREKLEPPSQVEVAEAMQQLQEIYPKTEAKSAEEQAQLALRLLQLATASDEPAARYALFQFAAELGQRAGDARLVDRALSQLASWYTVDVVPLKLKALTQIAKGAKDEGTIDALVAVSLTVAEAGMDAGQLEGVGDLLDAVAAACAKPAGRRHAKVVAELRNEVAKAKKPWAAAQLAKTKLEAEPDNAEAKTTLGAWTAFHAGDWSTGLPLLAQGSDEKLKTLAEQDLTAEQAGPREQLAAADAWYDAAQSAAEGLKPAMLRRAGHWYQAVLPMVKQQIARLKIEGRLEEIGKVASSGDAGSGAGELKVGKVYYLLGLTDLSRDVMSGDWLQRRESIRTETPHFANRFMLPVELDGSYEFEFDFTAPEGQVVAWLPVGDRSCQLWINVSAGGRGGPVSGLSLVDGATANRNQTRTPMPKLDWSKRHTVVARVEQSGEKATIDVTFDGKQLLTWRGQHEQLSVDPRNALRDSKCPGLGANNAPILFHIARLKLLDGSGMLMTSPAAPSFGQF